MARRVIGILLFTLTFCGCGKDRSSDPTNTLSSSGNEGRASTVATRPSQEQINGWLATDLPPFVEGIATSPVKLSGLRLEPNEFGQEILTVSYDRPAVVRTMASDLSLVLLPSVGGRLNVYLNPGLLIQPQSAGTMHGITESLLDHRGRIRVGMRAYIEMRAASMNVTGQKAERVSEVIWIGTEGQLFDAIQKGPPPRVLASARIPEPVLQPVPSGRIEKGTPLWLRCGDRWTRGNVLEDADGDRIRLLVYLVRRDKPYLPWVVNLNRAELRIEQEASVELQRSSNSFRDLADANDAKLSRQGVPNKLESIDVHTLQIGAAVLDFWNGMLDPCRVTGPVKDDAVPIQRVGLDNAKMVKSAKNLFVDPFGEQ